MLLDLWALLFVFDRLFGMFDWRALEKFSNRNFLTDKTDNLWCTRARQSESSHE